MRPDHVIAKSDAYILRASALTERCCEYKLLHHTILDYPQILMLCLGYRAWSSTYKNILGQPN